MARRINSRLRICGTLQAETPLHVGGYGVDVDTDLPLARNGKNQLYVSGTSITGVLRAWCESNFIKRDENGNPVKDKDDRNIPQEIVTNLFGFQKGESGQASFVLIEDAVVTLPNNLQTEIRDGVGIDRFYGTAADGAKYDRAILPKGSKLKFEITVEIQDEESSPQTKAIFGHLLEALQNQEIRFGASKTRGLGKVRLTTCEIKNHSLVGFNEILSFLSGGENTCTIQGLKDALPTLKPTPAKPKLEIEIVWKPTLPLMNKAGYEGIGVDMLPVTSGVEDGKLSLVLAGSSIKGAFRSQAERIVRTLLDIETPNKLDDSQNFSNQIRLLDKNGKNTESATKLIGEMFGAKKEKDKPNQPKSKLGLGALSIDDCYSVESFDQTNWREVEQGKLYDDKSYFEKIERNENGREVEEVTLHRALRKIDLGKDTLTVEEAKEKTRNFHVSHHTAIDRFTGGVADGALYSVLAPHNIEWKPIKISLDFGRTGENDKCCLMLLLLVLRDLADKRLPLGFATNRGMGEIEVGKIEMKGSYNIVWENGQFFFADESQKIIIGKDWQEFIKSFQNQLVSENMEENMPEKQNLEEQETLIFDSEKQKTGEKILLHQDTEQNRFHKSQYLRQIRQKKR